MRRPATSSASWPLSALFSSTSRSRCASRRSTWRAPSSGDAGERRHRLEEAAVVGRERRAGAAALLLVEQRQVAEEDAAVGERRREQLAVRDGRRGRRRVARACAPSASSSRQSGDPRAASAPLGRVPGQPTAASARAPPIGVARHRHRRRRVEHRADPLAAARRPAPARRAFGVAARAPGRTASRAAAAAAGPQRWAYVRPSSKIVRPVTGLGFDARSAGRSERKRATAEGLKPRDLLPRRGEGACPPLVRSHSSQHDRACSRRRVRRSRDGGRRRRRPRRGSRRRSSGGSA